MNNHAIGLLDSGVGGFSIVKKVIQKLPNESTIFIGDSAHMPYGDRTTEEVIELTRKSVNFLLSKQVKLIIFACNTATAAAMDILQKEVDPQIIGVIQSGSLAAARITKNKKVAVVATKVTIDSHAYRDELTFRDPEIEVTELATPRLAPLIEKHEDNLEEVKTSLAPLAGKDFDTLVLGCTHYPLAQAEFEAAVGNKVQVVDPADQVAQYTYNVMKREHLFSDPNLPPKHEYYTTGDPVKFADLGKSFMEVDELPVQQIDTENF